MRMYKLMCSYMYNAIMLHVQHAGTDYHAILYVSTCTTTKFDCGAHAHGAFT
jgi:hypothetical protein